VLSGAEHHAAHPSFPLMGLPAHLLRHPHRHLLLLPATPVCQRTSTHLKSFSLFGFGGVAGSKVRLNPDPRSNKDLDALTRALPYVLDISVHRLRIIVTYIFNSLC